MRKYFIIIVLSTISALSWAQAYLSPNQLGSGNLPGTYANLIFTLSDGNWTSQVKLPTVANDNTSIKILSRATYNTQVLQANTDVPLPALNLSSGQSVQYLYNAKNNRWEIVAPTLWANGSPMALATTEDRIVRVRMKNGAWAPSVDLPVTASQGQIVLIQSSAQWASRIVTTHVLHASTMPLRANDEYAFVFNKTLGKWVLSKGPETKLQQAALIKGELPATTTALTRLNINWEPLPYALQLPVSAGDRDRIIVTSSVKARSSIANTNVKDVGTMTIGEGQTYEFMWDAAANTWVLMQAPRKQVMLKSLSSAALPALQTPVTEVLAWDGNWLPSVTLPMLALPGDRVVVQSSASWGFTVEDGGTAGFGRYTVSNGEQVAFIWKGAAWQRETDTVRILLTYGQGVAAKLGTSAARSRQIESLRLTNESLENSGAKFRFQIAGLLEVPNLGSTLNEAVVLGRSNTIIQNERARVAADAIYYEGIENGCGLAWVNSSPSSFNMLATGSLNCGTTVMRHELGHNMGLNHGNGVIGTVMSGNAVPFFATPTRFDATLRIPTGYGANVPDEVAKMNKNAPAVSRFR